MVVDESQPSLLRVGRARRATLRTYFCTVRG
jgi:hypothetical protein